LTPVGEVRVEPARSLRIHDEGHALRPESGQWNCTDEAPSRQWCVIVPSLKKLGRGQGAPMLSLRGVNSWWSSLVRTPLRK
jgi:hypothetical protein